jgi:excisionase family DNA binding protein
MGSLRRINELPDKCLPRMGELKMARKERGRNWLSIGRIGMYCRVSTATVRRWIKNGDLQAIRLPSGHFRVSIADFKDFLKRHEMPISEELELYEMTHLEARLFEAVKSNPEGASLIQLAETLKIAPVVAGRVSRSLLDMGKIRKEDNRYYPS